MSESDKDKEILRLALESEARFQVKKALEKAEYNLRGAPYSKSYRVLKRLEEELDQEAHRIIDEGLRGDVVLVSLKSCLIRITRYCCGHVVYV